MKRVVKFTCVLLVAVLSIGLQASAQKKVKDSKTTYAREVLQPYVDNGQLSGAISVFYKDGVQEVSCVGYADVAAKRPIKLDNVFMQCSQTKGFCGVTIAKLVEEGKTDHRVGLTLYKIDAVMDGNLDEIIDALATADQAEKLKNAQ